MTDQLPARDDLHVSMRCVRSWSVPYAATLSITKPVSTAQRV